VRAPDRFALETQRDALNQLVRVALLRHAPWAWLGSANFLAGNALFQIVESAIKANAGSVLHRLVFRCGRLCREALTQLSALGFLSENVDHKRVGSFLRPGGEAIQASLKCFRNF
jgi:hypothetical protein